MKGKSRRVEKAAVFSVLTLTAVIAFLAGYGFQKLILTQTNIKTNVNNINRRELGCMHGKNIEKRNFDSRDRTPGDVEEEDKRFHNNAAAEVNATYIKNMLEYLSKEPHMGGTKRSLELAEFIKNEWIGHDFDTVELKDYYPYLSYPRKPAALTMTDRNGTFLYEAKMTEEAYFKEENHTENVYPFSAYTASGDCEGEYVYVNYAEIRDYEWLFDHKIELKGKIHIAKYGFAFRGEKARLAEKYGALGLLLFPDPEDHNDINSEGYPHTWEIPAGAMPRGNILNVKGDPLTPLYAAKENVFRRKPEKIQHFAKIPVQPISFGVAYKLLSTMNGAEIPDPSWQGGMNFTYTVAPTDGRRLHLVVDAPKEIRKITNVIGTIQGETEPDRIVMIGNHRDGWTYGALDPSSGTAVLMEVARILGKMLKDNWKPRRTIMLCSWDAEEYGLMGSVEWGQEYFNVLQQRAVAYLNVDIAVSGNYTFRAKSTPLLMDKLYDITKRTADPDSQLEGSEKPNLYDSWRRKTRMNVTEPPYANLGSGSDFTFFASVIGISCVDIRYMYDQASHPRLSNYPTYHTLYDNFNYMTKFIDPDFRYHSIVAKVWLLYTIEIADEIILPFNVDRYADKILNDAIMFEMNFDELFKPRNITMDEVKKAAFELKQAAQKLHERLKTINKADCHTVRRYNDQLMQFDRSFIVPEGLPGRPDIRHIVYSPTRKTLFSKNVFPAISDFLYRIEVENSQEWDGVEEQLSLLATHLNAATSLISNFNEI